MLYIKLDENMNLVITVNEPIYRGDRLNKKIVFLIPKTVGEIDTQSAAIYLSYIRADGTADITLLTQTDTMYNDNYYQYTLPVTSSLTRYAGEICAWLQIYKGSPRNPVIAKSGECILHILESKNMDEYIGDRNLSLIYEMQKSMENRMDEAKDALNLRIDSVTEELSRKADNVIFDEESGQLQLLSGNEPIGDTIIIKAKNDDVDVTGAEINDSGELVITFSNGTEKNLGVVVGKDGAVYVPHIDAHSVLTWTIEAEPDGVPDEIDLNPNDEWSEIDESEISSDYIWENM